MIRGPNSMGPSELSFNTRPASAARLLLAHAADTRMDPILHARIRDVCTCLPMCPGDKPGLAACGCFPGEGKQRGTPVLSAERTDMPGRTVPPWS